MRVLVCGGRGYSDMRTVFETLRRLDPSLVIEGGATGADLLAKKWAKANGVKYITFEAMWGVHGNAAGPVRNQQMIEQGKPDLVVAFPGGKGTADMVRRAQAAKIRVIEIPSEPGLSPSQEHK